MFLRGIAAASIIGLLTACAGGGATAPPAARAATPHPPAAAFVVEVLTDASGTTNNVVASVPLAGGSGYALGPFAGQITVAAAPGSDGTIFVERRVDATDEVDVYGPSASAPALTFPVLSHLGPVRFAVDDGGRLYMPGGTRNVIEVYDVAGGAHVATLAPGVNDPVCIAIQADGTLYVGGRNPNAVAVIPPGRTTPSRVITALDGAPRGVAVDDAGALYVADGVPAHGDVQVFAPGATVAQYGLAVNGPSGVAVDASGTLYVATADDSIEIYPPGATAPSRTLPLSGIPDSITI